MTAGERNTENAETAAGNLAGNEPTRVIGTSPPRIDSPAKLTGEARFGADIQLPGVVHGKLLRSPHAHARIRSIDTRQAEQLPGVCGVVTAGDFPDVGRAQVTLHEIAIDVRSLCDNQLARGKALYVGHAIAGVAAATAALAEEALGLIRVEYELLPPVLDVLEAMKEGAPLLHEELRTSSLAGESQTPSNVSSHLRHVKGDPPTGFSEADVVVEREYRTATVHQGYIEPHAATAQWEADGRLTVYTTTQGSFTVRDELSLLLGLPLSRIRVVPMEVGGGFGGKGTSYLAAPAALLAQRAGRPVKLTMTRSEIFQATGPTAGTAIRIKLAGSRDGRITAAQAQLYYESGGFPGCSWVDTASMAIFAAYDVPHAQVDAYDVVVNKPRTGAYRAPGTTQAIFAVEQTVDELAGKLALDPLEFRLQNAATEGTRQVHGPVLENVGTREVLEAARTHPHYQAPLGGENRGRGVAFAVWANWGGESTATISVHSDGTVNLVTGSVDLTGTRTSLAMQAAEALGIGLDRISPMVGDTDSVGFTQLTGGSRTTVATGTAVHCAAQSVIAEMRERAAMIWDIPPGSVAFHQGAFNRVGDVGERLTFDQVAALMTETGGPITGVGSINQTKYGGTCAAHIVDVEVDPETGKVDVLRYTAVQNPGRAVNPVMVEGQLQGGVAQGTGWALCEGYLYDEQGAMLNPHFLDYKLPTTTDLPSIDTVLVEVPYPGHPYGLRGVGEAPILPPPAAIANAVCRATGVRQCQLPMTPARILESMGML